MASIENVEIINDNLIKLYVNQEVPFFEYNLTFPIVSSSFFGGDTNIAQSDKNNLPMGTGKYRLQSIDIATNLTLKENSAWWNTENVKLRINNITVRIYGNASELYNAYKLGGLDLITSQRLNVEDNIGTIGTNIKSSYGRNFDYLALNTASQMLSNKEVRQAINYAINKGEIVNSVYGGKYIASDFPLSYGSYLYNETSQGYEFNQDKAKQILVDNGWEFAWGNWQKKIEYNTLRLKINLVVQSSNENRVRVAEIIKKNLEEIGIPVTIIKSTDATYQNYLNNKNYDMILTRCYCTD